MIYSSERGGKEAEIWIPELFGFNLHFSNKGRICGRSGGQRLTNGWLCNEFAH